MSMYDWPSESDTERQLRQEKNALEKKLELVETGLGAALDTIMKEVQLLRGDRAAWTYVYEALDFRNTELKKDDLIIWHKDYLYAQQRKVQKKLDEARRLEEEQNKKMLISSAALKLTSEEKAALGIHNMATAPTVIHPNQNRLDGKSQQEVFKDMGK